MVSFTLIINPCDLVNISTALSTKSKNFYHFVKFLRYIFMPNEIVHVSLGDCNNIVFLKTEILREPNFEAVFFSESPFYCLCQTRNTFFQSFDINLYSKNWSMCKVCVRTIQQNKWKVLHFIQQEGSFALRVAQSVHTIAFESIKNIKSL